VLFVCFFGFCFVFGLCLAWVLGDFLCILCWFFMLFLVFYWVSMVVGFGRFCSCVVSFGSVNSFDALLGLGWLEQRLFSLRTVMSGQNSP